MKYAVITGVSTGIGLATCQLLIEKGITVIGTVRQADQGNRMVQELGPRFVPVVVDVQDIVSIKAAARKVRNLLHGSYLAGLINNAGIAVTGPLMHIPIEKIDLQLDVNVLGPIRMIQEFLPLLGATSQPTGTPGRIINISSIAGKVALPYSGPYSASKFALEALSDSLRRELLIYGIKVILVLPGPIKTPIWDKAMGESVNYENTDFARAIRRREDLSKQSKKRALEPEAAARVIWKVLTKKRVATRYVVTNQKWRMWYLPQMLPDKWMDFVVARLLKIS